MWNLAYFMHMYENLCEIHAYVCEFLLTSYIFMWILTYFMHIYVNSYIPKNELLASSRKSYYLKWACPDWHSFGILNVSSSMSLIQDCFWRLKWEARHASGLWSSGFVSCGGQLLDERLQPCSGYVLQKPSKREASHAAGLAFRIFFRKLKREASFKASLASSGFLNLSLSCNLSISCNLSLPCNLIFGLIIS